ncbi:hypothetical protein GOARA_022_00160 [Gordonia araii NBRC 100433]|uniref:Lipoprotein n=1 Tax=Gordonia araii NBRC 100433 TaxID=1073574 RepID=G7GZB5_9ACTN|nr:hypothetical protein [Gordonia araii]NNG98652.1 hypothetical protein [Gordonia araii NBRC 100433]GAB08940.1 hypothetical protein GOARA_022_00160 [Gordonia araii NBRC 100433]
MRGSHGGLLVAATAVALVVSGCATEDDRNPDAPVPVTTVYTSEANGSPSSSAAPAAVSEQGKLPDGWYRTNTGTLATPCGGSRNPGTVFDVQKGTWIDVPAPRSIDDGETEEEKRCAIVGDPDDPVVIYGRVVRKRASGVTGESIKPEVYAMKVKDGSADKAVDLTSLLAQGADVEAIGAYPGGFYLLENGVPGSNNLIQIGLKLIALDGDLKASVTNTLVKFPSQLSSNANDLELAAALLSYDPSHLKAPGANVVKLPSGARLGIPDDAHLVEVVDRFAVYQEKHPSGTTAPIKIMDSASGKVVTTPITTTALGYQIQAWGNLVRITSTYVVDMSTGKVLLDSTKEKNPAPNKIAGKYLYVKDDLKDPVIDLTTGKTVHEGWSRRPIARIKGWTIVSNTDDLGEGNLTLVRDDDKGEYAGPWW